jgi:hypothetical protein
LAVQALKEQLAAKDAELAKLREQVEEQRRRPQICNDLGNPVAFAVSCSRKHEDDYKVFCSEDDADQFAQECIENYYDDGMKTDWNVYPLYACTPTVVTFSED